MTNEQKIKVVTVESYTIAGTCKRAMLTVELENGTAIPVSSPSEEGESAGIGAYSCQAESGKVIAKNHNARYLEIDHDLIDKVLAARISRG